jgi:hypothetical protein
VGQFTTFERFVSFDGQERRLLLPSGTTLCGRNPTIGFGPDGQVLIVYESTQERGLRYFSGSLQTDGELIGQDFPLIEGESCLGDTPAIAVDKAGRVVIVYRGPHGGELLYLSGYLNPSGQIIGRRFSLTRGRTRRGYAPSVAIDGNGQISVVYQDLHDGRPWCLAGIIDHSGRIHGPTFPLDKSKTKNGIQSCSLAFDSNGRAIIINTAPNGYGLRYLYGCLQSGRLVGEWKPLRIGAKYR